MASQIAIAANTKRIRLGQAANIVVWHHPVRIAELVAMLDCVSGGRVEFGMGRGYQPRENEVFGKPYGLAIQDQERNRVAFAAAGIRDPELRRRPRLIKPASRYKLHRASGLRFAGTGLLAERNPGLTRSPWR